MMVVTVPPYMEVEWASRTADWLIPYNTTDWGSGPVQTMLRLGTGSIVLDYGDAASVLERVDGALTVVYVLSDCVASVRYKWNSMLLQSLDGLLQSTRLYASIVAENTAYRERANVLTDRAQLHQVYGSISAAGAVTLHA
ncbi:hypothetical protein BG60_09280 [Caballeronia zhejiangensis]|uniref:Uncharacterized protein n=1 Tax=Caballeronia zhejiangensis TaxID=871203 RepID=A0A656QIN2_9BURK|nr:hypothetical protein BG58_28455 [Caballeronia jiangsuensis]KDR28891.1 hypothetical protein BG60_09280 [Caballeronia zhejiangensis]KWU19222.1 hypothetical protein AS149_13335 [Burkholderia cenocepacia]